MALTLSGFLIERRRWLCGAICVARQDDMRHPLSSGAKCNPRRH